MESTMGTFPEDTSPDEQKGHLLVSTPIEVLESFAELLGENEAKVASTDHWSRIPWEAGRSSGFEGSNGDDDADCDFSSFPSLSIQKKGSDGVFLHSKEDVEGHCASLLSRPILVNNDPAAHCPEDEDTEDDEEEEVNFIAESVSQVPGLLRQNLTATFSTLVQSRLRAYASFLAGHGLAVTEQSETTALDLGDRVVGVEQKLGTMLEIGSLISLDAMEVSFHCQREGATSQEDGDDLKVSLPLGMEALLGILVPTVRGDAEKFRISFKASGTLTGVFNKSCSSHLLRAVQLDLDTREILSSVKQCAESVVSNIVKATNAAFSKPLPHLVQQEAGQKRPVPEEDKEQQLLNTKKQPPVMEDFFPTVSPDLGAVPAANYPSDLDLTEHDVFSSLSPDRCGKIVDYLFDEVDRRVLSPPGKRARFSSLDDPNSDELTTTSRHH